MSTTESTSNSPPGNHAYEGKRTGNDLPSGHSDRPHPRQKRKRTSPEDQEILEAAYKRDPKPDKTARMSLVERVSLGEKEVQIWFQNRRQSSRRRSRPLLPHEVAEYQQSRAGVSSSAAGSSQDSDGLVRYESGVDSEESRHESPEPSIGSDVFVDANAVKSEDTTWTSNSAVPASIPKAPQDSSTGASSLPAPASHAVSSAQSSSIFPTHDSRTPIGYIANRRSMSSLRQSVQTQSSPASSWPERSDRQLKRVSSCVRLSMNAEGKAEIITKDASSPSPPRPKQTFILPDVSLNNAPTPDFSSSQGLQRSVSGRSRDSRSWEFWCDKESRSELKTTAEKDASGSAAGAIGLLRTASGRNILGSVSGKRNSAFSNHPASAKRSKLGQRKPLQRASTSLGRLQSKHGHGGASLPKLKHSGSAASLRIKGNDSDKENWSPERELDSDGEEISQLDGESGRRSMATQGQSRSHKVIGRKRQSQDDENEHDPEADAELEEFMAGGRKSEDLDCVQGLLSLSQGNWK